MERLYMHLTHPSLTFLIFLVVGNSLVGSFSPSGLEDVMGDFLELHPGPALLQSSDSAATEPGGYTNLLIFLHSFSSLQVHHRRQPRNPEKQWLLSKGKNPPEVK